MSDERHRFDIGSSAGARSVRPSALVLEFVQYVSAMHRIVGLTTQEVEQLHDELTDWKRTVAALDDELSCMTDRLVAALEENTALRSVITALNNDNVVLHGLLLVHENLSATAEEDDGKDAGE
jgi:hypothetical protein